MEIVFTVFMVLVITKLLIIRELLLHVDDDEQNK